MEPGTPSISVRIEGVVRDLIVGTGSNISILQPGISKSELEFTDSRPYGVTGETLDVKGRQAVSFVLGGREFNHQFLVCSLPIEAAGLLGLDFLKESGAIVNLECIKCRLLTLGKRPKRMAQRSIKALLSRSFWKAKRDTALNLPDGKLRVLTSKFQLTPP
jgi:hypothetical protein